MFIPLRLSLITYKNICASAFQIKTAASLIENAIIFVRNSVCLKKKTEKEKKKKMVANLKTIISLPSYVLPDEIDQFCSVLKNIDDQQWTGFSRPQQNWVHCWCLNYIIYMRCMWQIISYYNHSFYIKIFKILQTPRSKFLAY